MFAAVRRVLPERTAGILAGVALLSIVVTGPLGTFAAALFIVAVVAMIVIAPKTVAMDVLRFMPVLLLPLLALASTLWSDAPERTLRAALQLLLTAVAAIVIARRLDPSRMVLLTYLGSIVVCLLMLPGIPDALAYARPLDSNLLGSKNQVGFVAQLLIALALAVAADVRQPFVARLSTLGAIALAVPVLVLSQSAGASTALIVTLATFPALAIFGRLDMSMRAIVFVLAVALGLIAFAFLPDLQSGWAEFRVDVLKKDATLTGRTYLWDVAARLNAERPWLGRGYYAFWRQGNIEAEGLWRWGGIGARTGFNFHNAFVEMQVDLGWIGRGLFVATCAVIAIAGSVRQLLRPSAPMAFLLSLLAVLYLRSYAESGLIAPFSLLALLWIATLVYAVDGSGTMPPRRSPRHDRMRAIVPP